MVSSSVHSDVYGMLTVLTIRSSASEGFEVKTFKIWIRRNGTLTLVWCCSIVLRNIAHNFFVAEISCNLYFVR